MNVFSVSLASRPLAMTAAPSAVIRLQVASNDNRILLCLRQSARATAPSFPRPFQEISTLFRRAFICGTDKISHHTAPWFNIKAVFQGRGSNYQDETVMRPFYVYNGNSYTGKTVYKTSRPRRPINQLGDLPGWSVKRVTTHDLCHQWIYHINKNECTHYITSTSHSILTGRPNILPLVACWVTNNFRLFHTLVRQHLHAHIERVPFPSIIVGHVRTVQPMGEDLTYVTPSLIGWDLSHMTWDDR